jgi:hydroxylamine reductase (hybrid-cluster protein)
LSVRLFFATLTNVNFDTQRFVDFIGQSVSCVKPPAKVKAAGGKQTSPTAGSIQA